MRRKLAAAEAAERARAFSASVIAAAIAAIIVLATVAAWAQNRSASAGEQGPAGWIDIDYGALVDQRRLSHSGESIGVLLRLLNGRPAPPPGERREDLTSHVLLEPLIEPYAFVLSDALDTLSPPPTEPLVEIGALWQPGETQPAWAELLRARRYVVESDGAGRLRVCLPWEDRVGASNPPDGSSHPTTDSTAAARLGWDEAWPVLRHVFAAERRRLSRRGGASASEPPLDITVHAYRHFPARSRFQLGLSPFRTRVEDTRGRGPYPPADLAAWQSFLARGLLFEGGRLEPDGTVRLIGSEVTTPPTLLGRPLGLADFAVAYRAVAQGGLGEPYMSLDRGGSPQSSLVNYGGRLQDTSLGLVSLQCDIRFKTFSLGIDILEAKDLREALRRELPSFRTHMERFAADPRSQGVLAQQTRLWFYPDAVDLTLSPENDILILRRPRMSAANERIEQEGPTGQRPADPPWTEETVAAINKDYDALARAFPELGDLDQVVRLLSFATWLRQASVRGLPVPDLGDLLALELPAQPTPRNFPQLLAYNALPPSGTPGEAQVFNRVSVGEALDRLQPATGQPLPAMRRLRRALAALDRTRSDHAALAKEIEAYDLAALDESSLDVLSTRAERLRMHQLVLGTLPTAEEQAVQRRREKVEGLRTLSVGIGGLDLGMSQALARAEGRDARARAPERSAAPSPAPRTGGPWPDPRALPALLVPDHGTKGGSQGGASKGAGAGPELRVFRTHWTDAGKAGTPEGELRWTHVVTGADGPDPRSRRVIFGRRSPPIIERVEEGRFLRFHLARDGSRLVAKSAAEGLPPDAAAKALGPGAGVASSGSAQASAAPAAAPPPGLVTLGVSPASATGAAAGAETGGGSDPAEQATRAGEPTLDTATLRLQVRGEAGRELSAAFPRPVLQRLLLGREVDLTPDRPLPGLTPPSRVLGESKSLMVIGAREQSLPPWHGPAPVAPGEEDPSRIAGALARWWASESSVARLGTSVGTDPERSPGRWRSATGIGVKPALLLPEDGFPGAAVSLRESIGNAWKVGPVVSRAASIEGATLVILVSAEDPTLCGARLRELARDPAMKGHRLAAWPLGGHVRPDVPASLLAEGNLASLGVASYTPLGPGRIVEEIRALGAALAVPGARDLRPEELSTPFVWYY